MGLQVSSSNITGLDHFAYLSLQGGLNRLPLYLRAFGVTSDVVASLR